MRVPVLRGDDVVETPGELVDEGNDLIAARHGECATGAEVDLQVDEDECVGVQNGHAIKGINSGWLH